MRHELKTWPEFYAAVRENKKTFELRYDDRKYSVDDELVLREFEPCHTCKGKGKVCVEPWSDKDDLEFPDCTDCYGTGGRYTGLSMCYSVTYILRVHAGIRGGYVIMGLYSLASGDAFV